MADFFAIYVIDDFAPRGLIAITGSTTEEVMAAAEEAKVLAPANYYLFAISTRHGNVEGKLLWVINTEWNYEAFEMHVNPSARED